MTDVSCNADLNHPCDTNDGEPCSSCEEEKNYWFKMWLLSKKDRDKKLSKEEEDQELIDAGRGHLVLDNLIGNN